MKLLDKQIVTVQVYAGRKFGTMIGSNDGLIGILINSSEYIWAPMGSSLANVIEKNADGKYHWACLRKSK